MRRGGGWVRALLGAGNILIVLSTILYDIDLYSVKYVLLTVTRST